MYLFYKSRGLLSNPFVCCLNINIPWLGSFYWQCLLWKCMHGLTFFYLYREGLNSCLFIAKNFPLTPVPEIQQLVEISQSGGNNATPWTGVPTGRFILSLCLIDSFTHVAILLLSVLVTAVTKINKAVNPLRTYIEKKL